MGDAVTDDTDLVARLRARDEQAYVAILDDWSDGMLRLAREFVSTSESARDVVQDTWIAVIRGVDAFEGRSSLRTWVYRILINTAKRRGVQEKRTAPMSSVLTADQDSGPTVDPERFQSPEEPYPGHWRASPAEWPSPEQALLDAEVRTRVAAALDCLPPRQRMVIDLRDVQGYSSDEVCAILQISAANQRVLLHRARAAVRCMLEEYFAAPTDQTAATIGKGRT